jgi:hypothetical protein
MHFQHHKNVEFLVLLSDTEKLRKDKVIFQIVNKI